VAAKAETFHLLPSNLPYDTVEILAKAIMNGKRFEPIATSRPNGEPLGKVYSDYKVPADALELFYAMVPMAVLKEESGGSQPNLADLVYKSLEQAKQRCGQIDIDRAKEGFVKVMTKVRNQELRMQDLADWNDAFARYHGALIEYEFMIPDIKAFSESVEGKIAVLVGKFHAQGINDSLNGKKPQRPLDWNEYVSGLKERETIQRVFKH